MRNTIIRVWTGEASLARGLLYIPLAFLSLLYRIILMAREYMYKTGIMGTEASPIPVVSVGNITLGGTGKTPVVERLASQFKARGFNPGIVTRGYMRKKKGTFPVDIGSDTAETAGDEAYMLARKTRIPVIVGTNRLSAIRCGIETNEIDMAILDDGFQVRDLKKDVDILLLNGKESLSRQELFPLGPYREPIERVRSSDTILFSKGEPDSATLRFTRDIPTFRVHYRPVHLYNMKRDLIAHFNYLKGLKTLAFSGLGDNSSFFGLLRTIGADVVSEMPYPDHHRYTKQDLERIRAVDGIECIVTTEKDAVKLSGMDMPENLFYLSIEARIEDEEALVDLLLKKIGKSYS